MRGLVTLLPLHVEITGRPTDRPALWASNHVSWLDIAVLGAHSPLSFLSKWEVRQWPVIGWLARAAGTLFIKRGQAAGQAIEAQLGSRLGSGVSLVIFPEGTTTEGDRVRAFHGRLFSSALAAQVPIQPDAGSYQRNGQLDHTAPFVGDDDFHRHLWRLLGSERISVQVKFLPPIPSAGCTRNQLARAAQSQISQALGLKDETLRAVPSCRKVA
jgi:1-acyl-sn-glycerol-3-phosphate acyltransferase